MSNSPLEPSLSLHIPSINPESPTLKSDFLTPNTSPLSPPSPSTPPHLSHSPSKNVKVSAPFQFGLRHLSDTADPFTFNAWDHVPPPSAHLQHAETQYALQRSSPVSAFDRQRFNTDPAKWWDRFYAKNTANFFKDRKWLRQEFPVLEEVTRSDAGPRRVLEVGAGAGNTAFPVLQGNENEHLMVHACDFSNKAVEIMRTSPQYDPRYLDVHVWDITSATLPPGVAENSVDVVLLIFIFSALSPEQWPAAVRNVYRVLKPGGEVCFRDYGRGDLAQVRFRKGRWMEENFYVRGDGTRVYFFAEDELRRIWGGARTAEADRSQGELGISGDKSLERAEQGGTENEPSEIENSRGAVFEIASLGVDRRMLVNRQKELKMYRCWMQARFRKPVLGSDVCLGD